LVEFLCFLVGTWWRRRWLAALPLALAALTRGFQEQPGQALDEAAVAAEQAVHGLDEVGRRGDVAVLHATDVRARPAATGQRRELLLRQPRRDPQVVERVTELPDRGAGWIYRAKLATVRHLPFTSNAADRKHRFLLAARAEGVFLFRTNIAIGGPLYMTRVHLVA